MFINKIGKHHLDLGENCQDAGKIEYFTDDELYASHKIICDGCSEGKHSDVGAKLYALRTNSIVDLYANMELIVRFISCEGDFFRPFSMLYPDTSLIRDYCCFTILDLWEINDGKNSYDESNEKFDGFCLHYCGDGYIITLDYEDNINFEKIDDGEYPKYLAYNYIKDKSRMSHYKDGVNFAQKIFSRKDFKNVGIASDGIRYILNHEDEALKNEFIDILKDNKEIKMKRFINKHQSIFKDDITIAF